MIKAGVLICFQIPIEPISLFKLISGCSLNLQKNIGIQGERPGWGLLATPDSRSYCHCCLSTEDLNGAHNIYMPSLLWLCHTPYRLVSGLVSLSLFEKSHMLGLTQQVRIYPSMG